MAKHNSETLPPLKHANGAARRSTFLSGDNRNGPHAFDRSVIGLSS
jgi:hypothetical protein